MNKPESKEEAEYPLMLTFAEAAALAFVCSDMNFGSQTYLINLSKKLKYLMNKFSAEDKNNFMEIPEIKEALRYIKKEKDDEVDKAQGVIPEEGWERIHGARGTPAEELYVQKYINGEWVSQGKVKDFPDKIKRVKDCIKKVKENEYN